MTQRQLNDIENDIRNARTVDDLRYALLELLRLMRGNLLGE